MKKINRSLLGLFYLGAFVSGIDTLLVISCGAYVGALELLGNKWAAISTSVVIGAAGTYALDWLLQALLPDTLKMYTSGLAKKHRQLSAYLLLLCIGLGASTIAVSLNMRHFVASTIIAAPKAAGSEAIAAHEKSTTASVVAMDKSMSTLSAQRKAAIANAGNAQLRSLAAAGNAWAKSEMDRVTRKATSKLDKEIESLMASKNTFLTEASSTANRLATTQDQLTQQAIKAAERNRATVAGMQMILSIGGTIAMFIAALGVALVFAKYNFGSNPFNNLSTDPEDKTPPPPPGDGMDAETLEKKKAELRETMTALREAMGKIGMKSATEAPGQPPANDRIVNTTVSPQDAVITASNNSVRFENEFEGIKWNEDNQGKITELYFCDKPMDRTKMMEYYNTYSHRGETSKYASTRNDNKEKAAVLAKALLDIHSYNVHEKQI